MTFVSIANRKNLKLNLGCGKEKIRGFVNIDVEKSTKPDIVFDFITNSLPLKRGTVSTIFLFHTIEHIPESLHDKLIVDLFRVLRSGGLLIISYPEFTKCATNYINNYQGKREFWKHTIYGLQRYKSDYHVALMDTPIFSDKLKWHGFKKISSSPEPDEPFNTVIKAIKGKEIINYEDLLRREIFGLEKEKIV